MSYLINPSRFGAAAFTPTDISGLTFWIDYNNTGSLTLSGSDITGATDLAPDTAHNLGTSSPTVSAPVSTLASGKYWAVFTGASRDSMSGASTSASSIQVGSGSFALFVVVKTTATALKVAVQKGGSSNRYTLRINASGSGNIRGVISDGTHTVTVDSATGTAINDGNPHVIALIRDNTLFSGNGGLRVLLDGTDVSGSPSTLSGTMGSLNETSFPILVGASPSGGSTANEWDGSIGEVLLYNGVVLTSTEEANVNSYFQTKWGTP